MPETNFVPLIDFIERDYVELYDYNMDNLLSDWTLSTKQVYQYNVKVEETSENIHDYITTADDVHMFLQEFVKFVNNIVKTSMNLRISFGSERYTNIGVTESKTINISHPFFKSDTYEKMVPYSSIVSTTFGIARNILVNYMLDRLPGNDSSNPVETEPNDEGIHIVRFREPLGLFVPIVVDNCVVNTRDYRVEPPVTYLQRDINSTVLPVVITPNFDAKAQIEDLFTDTKLKYRMFFLNQDNDNWDELLRNIFLCKVIEQNKFAMIDILMVIATETFPLDIAIEALQDNITDNNTAEDMVNIVRQALPTASIIADAVNYFRQQLLHGNNLEQIIQIFGPNADRVISANPEIWETHIQKYIRMKNFVISNPPIFGYIVAKKEIRRYELSGTHSSIYEESLSYNGSGYLNKTSNVSTRQNQNGIIEVNRLCNRNVYVDSNAQVPCINIRIAPNGKVERSIPSLRNSNDGISPRQISIRTRNWRDARNISRYLNSTYSKLSFVTMSGDISNTGFNTIDDEDIRDLIFSSLSFSFNYQNLTKQGSLSFRYIKV